MPDTPRTPVQTFGGLIRTARLQAGLTQDDVATRAQVSPLTVGRYEANRATNPKPTKFRAICAALGVRPVDAAIALGYLTPDDLAQAA